MCSCLTLSSESPASKIMNKISKSAKHTELPPPPACNTRAVSSTVLFTAHCAVRSTKHLHSCAVFKIKDTKSYTLAEKCLPVDFCSKKRLLLSLLPPPHLHPPGSLPQPGSGGKSHGVLIVCRQAEGQRKSTHHMDKLIPLSLRQLVELIRTDVNER